MAESVLLSIAILAVFATLAIGVWHFGPRALGREKALRLTALCAAIGIAMAGWGFYADHELRVTTLAEAMLEGTMGLPGGAPAPSRAFSFIVEHAGVSHQLTVALVSDGALSIGAVAMNIVLEGPGGEVLIDTTRTFEVRTDRRSLSSWDALATDFTPSTNGRYQLTLTPLNTDIPRIHIRVGDPLKTDGSRIPGY